MIVLLLSAGSIRYPHHARYLLQATCSFDLLI